MTVIIHHFILLMACETIIRFQCCLNYYCLLKNVISSYIQLHIFYMTNIERRRDSYIKDVTNSKRPEETQQFSEKSD